MYAFKCKSILEYRILQKLNIRVQISGWEFFGFDNRRLLLSTEPCSCERSRANGVPM